MSAEIDPAAPLTPTGNLRRRLIVSRIAVGGATGAALGAVGVLGIVVFAVVKRGASQLSIDFLTKNPPQFPGPRRPVVLGWLRQLGRHLGRYYAAERGRSFP